MKKLTKCYIYTRVSTAIQVDGYSLEAQKEKLRKFAEYQGYEVAREYSDEGFSGKNIQGRLEFQRMLKDIQDGTDGVEYVLVFKLSRFGRNAADVLYSLQMMQDYGVNLICVEDGIDSSKDAGKLMISVLSAVAEIERENIRIIFDRFIHTTEGINGVANYLNNHGYKKKLRQNNTIEGFSTSFVKKVLDNSVYMGKIAYGRRKTEKKIGTRNEMHIVEQSEYPIYEGQHEAIISEEDWNLAQVKRKRLERNEKRLEKLVM